VARQPAISFSISFQHPFTAPVGAHLTLAQKMKTLIQLILVISAALTTVHAEDAILPPKEQRAEWTELQDQKFSEWSIKTFLGWDVPFDGGSKVFFFESDGGESFDLVVAHPNYWTAQDKKQRRQVFLIRHKNRFYRIDSKSEEEKNMIQKLTEAAGKLSGEGKKDPKLLTSLAERLESREPIFKPKG
jgi:hypothetical protein